MTCSLWHIEAMKNMTKPWLDNNRKYKLFSKVDVVLVFNTRMGSHLGKLKMRWIRLYVIYEQVGLGTFTLANLQGDLLEKLVNGFRLKPCMGKIQFNTYDVEVHVGLIQVGFYLEVNISQSRSSGDTFEFELMDSIDGTMIESPMFRKGDYEIVRMIDMKDLNVPNKVFSKVIRKIGGALRKVTRQFAKGNVLHNCEHVSYSLQIHLVFSFFLYIFSVSSFVSNNWSVNFERLDVEIL